MFHIGKIVNTHGLKGEVKVKIETDFPERFNVNNQVYLKENKSYLPLTITQSRLHKGMQIIKFSGYDDINAVEQWKNSCLYISQDQQEKLPEDEYYFHEIIGCKVFTLEGEYLGDIYEILTPGANDVWVVKTEDNQEMMIPYIDDVVKSIDIETKEIKIYLMEGLRDL